MLIESFHLSGHTFKFHFTRENEFPLVITQTVLMDSFHLSGDTVRFSVQENELSSLINIQRVPLKVLFDCTFN